MISNSQRTIYGLDLQTYMLMGKQYRLLPNTTLNEKFNILPDAEVGVGIYPTLKYMTIGVGGGDIINDSVLNHSKHRAIDASLFEYVPFVIRPIASDLPLVDQLKYRFRTIEIINSDEYVCYYLKVIPDHTMYDGLFQVATNADVSTLGFFDTNRPDLLSPTPRIIDNYIDKNSSTYIARTIKLMFELTEAEVTDINTAIAIKYAGNRTLTEIGVCTGTDTELDGRTEAKSVQINYFVEVNIDMAETMATKKTLLRNIEIGGAEPVII